MPRLRNCRRCGAQALIDGPPPYVYCPTHIPVGIVAFRKQCIGCDFRGACLTNPQSMFICRNCAARRRGGNGGCTVM